MGKKRRVVRPAMTRPVGVRRSAIAGEVRIYQELIRVVTEQTRLERESQLWIPKRQEIEDRLRAVKRYRQDLFKRLGLQGGDSPAPPEQKGDDNPAGQEGSQGVGSHNVIQLRYGGKQ